MNTSAISRMPMVSALSRRIGSLVTTIKRALRFPLAERVEYYDNMLAITKAGVPSSTALTEIYQANARLRRRYAPVYGELLQAVNSGKEFSTVVAGHFPPIEALVLSAGARAGSYDGYEAASKIGRGLQRIRTELLTNLTYPTILFAVLGAILAGFATVVLPQYERMKEKLILGTDMKVFIQLLELIRDDKAIVAGILCVAVAAVIWSLPRWTGKFRDIADRYVPIYMLYRLYTGAVVLLGLGAMLKAKVSMEDALKHVHSSANPYVAHHIGQVLGAVMRGKDEVAAWNTGLLQPSILLRISALAKAGTVGTAIAMLGDGSIEYCINVMKKIAASVAGIAVVLVAILVAYALTFLNTVGTAAATG
jgi:type II secretory pathway component PulF